VRKVTPAVLVILVAWLLQTGLARYLAIGGVVPNALLVGVVTVALATGPNEGASAGFAAGLLFDLLSVGPVGPMALVLSVTGFVAGLLHEQLFAEGWLLPLTVMAIASVLSEVAYALILGLVGSPMPFWSTLATKMLPGAVYNTVLALLVYPWLARYLRDDQPIKTFRRLA
jgi:rod shape-determining protein MreD